MDERQFKELSEKMDIIIRLLALNTVGGKQLRQQVLMLSSLGFQPKQIADVLGKTPNHIRVILHEIRKREAESVPEAEGNTTEVKTLEGNRDA